MAVFINYRREDTDGETRAIYNRLALETDQHHLFLDVEAIGGGEKWKVRIDDMLKKVRAVVIVIGPRWLELMKARAATAAFDSVRMEIAASLDKPGVQVIPVLVNGARIPEASALPDDIRGIIELNALEIRGSAWTADVSRLLKTLRSAGALPTSQRKWAVRVIAGLGALNVIALIALLFVLVVKVPEVPLDMSFSYARHLVESNGLKFEDWNADGLSTSSKGLYLASQQSPPGGSLRFRGQTVTVTFQKKQPYVLVCRKGASFTIKPSNDVFTFEKHDASPSGTMQPGTCAWLDRPLNQAESNFIRPLGFAGELLKRFERAPGGLLAFCAMSHYDANGRSPELVAVSTTNFVAPSDNGMLTGKINDYICVE